MANEQTGRERDLVLAPNQYAYIQDETKGGISAYVGPNKTSLAGTDRPVIFSANTRRYERCELSGAILEFPLANEGSYIVLENPAADGNQPHPSLGSANVAVKLLAGRKVNLRGPLTFPLWPGQVATVIDGHRLRSNQYVIVRVYDLAEATKNWPDALMQPASDPSANVQGGSTPGSTGSEQTDPAKLEGEKKPLAAAAQPATDLAMGRLIVIKGTDVSFYIPPTGIEVVPDGNRQFIREAVTLERLEYCILRDESGEKTVVKGPSVVFPKPTETFVEKDGERKFRAFELNQDMGIYIKVTADYEDGEKKRVTGEELFITGREQQIYYPRPEHAIIKYGDRELHYGVTIPEGEARYVLNKDQGSVDLVRGPRVFLPDPRREVMVRRVLETKEIELWYPGNAYALAYNQRLLEITRGSSGSTPQALEESQVRSAIPVTRNVAAASVGEFQRGSSYNPPRTITLDTKFEGAVAVSVWDGYAIKINSKTGESRVVVGPKTELLDYDESLQVLELSKGKPKTTDKLERTVYLRVNQNQVSDIVSVVTRDMVEVQVKVSYRVNFEGQPEKWFRVENYVKFLCDHARSMLRHVAKLHGIESFNDSYIPIIRDAILGQKPEDGGRRSGMTFEENGLRVYDVEVLGITIGDSEIARMLSAAQNKTVKTTLDLAAAERDLAATRRLDEIDVQKRELEKERIKRELASIVAKLTAEAKAAEERAKEAAKVQTREATASAAQLAVDKAEENQTLAFEKERLNEAIRKMEAETKALVEKAKAISPDLIAALQAFGSQIVATEAAKSMGPMTLLGGGTIAEVVQKTFGGTALGTALTAGLTGRSNGHSSPGALSDASAE